MSEQSDLFNQEHALTPDQRKKLTRKTPRPAGHAWRPGTGPAGETCKTCRFIVRKSQARTYIKCGLMERHWTRGPGTDIRANDPACREWKKPDEP